MKKTVIAVLAAVALAPVQAWAAAKVGAEAPAFTLEDADGKKRSLADYKGKVVVLEWHNHACPYVKKHYGSGNMGKLQKAYTEKGAVWLSIISSAEGKQGHVTGEEAKANMAAAGAVPSAVLFDPSGETGKAYGAKTTPHMYVVDAKGVLRYNGAIDDNPSSDPDDIPGAKPLLANAVDAVLAGKKVQKAVNRPYGCSVKY